VSFSEHLDDFGENRSCGGGTFAEIVKKRAFASILTISGETVKKRVLASILTVSPKNRQKASFSEHFDGFSGKIVKK